MSLHIDKEKIYEILQQKKYIIEKNILQEQICKTQYRFLEFTKHDIDNSCGNDQYINPLLWQMGHVVFFYIHLILGNLPNIKNIDAYHNLIQIKSLEDYVIFYDSHKTPLENRSGNLLLSYNECINYYNIIIDILNHYISKFKIEYIESYLIMLGILHNEMHNEAFIFTKMNMHQKILLGSSNLYLSDPIIDKLEYMYYPSGSFQQGSSHQKQFIFDNELPCFTKNVTSFRISKYPITEYQYLQFIESGGYNNTEYWSRNAFLWIKKNKIKMPLYWIKKDNLYFKSINDSLVSIETNLPVIHISYYEATAYCNWIGGRLPTESEYEYVSTNMGKTLFPWGNNIPSNDVSNINYLQYIVPVNAYQSGDNQKGVSQLIGNVWEWCDEVIYPYDGFTIDPVYREMSYPFFGYKKICKGGSFAVPDYLIHSSYRNAQYPDCRIQFIGFRVCIQ